MNQQRKQKKDHMANSPFHEYLNNHEIVYGPAGEARVQRELDSLKKNGRGDILLTMEDLLELDPRTSLTVLLNATAGGSRVDDPAVFHTIKEGFYRAFNPYIGGLVKAAFAKYAHECLPVTQAAANHRLKFIPSKK